MSNPSAPLVSVIVPVYNGTQYLTKTVDSILTQTYANLELILVDDGSKDDSLQLIKQLAERDNRIKPFSKSNGGVAHTRNYAIERSQGEFIALCDQDDLWFPEKLEQQIPLFDNPDVGLVYCGAQIVHEHLNKTSNPGFHGKQRGRVFERLAQENMFTCCTAVVRKTCLTEVDGFDADRALMGVDDWHLWLKLALVCEFDFVAEHLCAHVFHGNNYSANNKKMHDAEMVCLDKIIPLANEKGISIDWDTIQYNIHTRYAQDYIFASEYQYAAEAYQQANRLKPNFKAALKQRIFRWTPGTVLRLLQSVKRSLRR